jgi:tRNA(fMet)-specific endonuclease VapC
VPFAPDVAAWLARVGGLRASAVATGHGKPRVASGAAKRFLSPFEVSSFDEAAAGHYGDIRAYLEKSGTPIGAMDLLIAAYARSLSLTLVTNNLREFERVPGLSTDNWA